MQIAAIQRAHAQLQSAYVRLQSYTALPHRDSQIENEMKIHQIPLLRDNYGYLLVCENPNKLPSSTLRSGTRAAPDRTRTVPLAAISKHTHHRDHTAENEGICAPRVEVYGHKSDGVEFRINPRTEEGDEIRSARLKGKSFHSGPYDGTSLSVREQLFCATRFHGRLRRLSKARRSRCRPRQQADGPAGNTKVYCATNTPRAICACHAVEPKNPRLVSRFERVQGLRSRGASTVPSTCKKRTNQPVSALGQQGNSSQCQAASQRSSRSVSVFAACAR